MAKITDTSTSLYAQLDSVDIESVKIENSLLFEKMKVNSERSLIHQYNECERTGRVDNFRIAAGMKDGEISNRLAADSDVYKWIEAASYSLIQNPNSKIEQKLDEVIEIIRKAQWENGYINTAFTFRKDEIWKHMDKSHELYCGGHLIQAAVAHHRVTGKTDLLDVAIKWADYVCDYFGSSAHLGTDGHPEVEMALVELFRETKNRKYLDQAIFFTEQRGTPSSGLGGSHIMQDHAPIREQVSMQGHAVRQLYLCCGVADIYAETGDDTLFTALKSQWNDFTKQKMAVTGGAGSRWYHEAFGIPYEIPNRIGYYETCAAIASFMWNWRMLQITGEASYADIMEYTLYNGILSGMSLDGMKYFYTNPLEHDGISNIATGYSKPRERGECSRTSRHWDHTACCPPNVARIIASLPGYIYNINKKHDSIWVNHYVANSARINVKDTVVNVRQKTCYPWEGNVQINIDPEREVRFTLFLRIPRWAKKASIKVNEENVYVPLVPGSYVQIDREWSSGDVVTVEFPMPVVKLRANPKLSDNAGCVALMRGPIVYCIEEADYDGIDIYRVAIPHDAQFVWHYEEELLGGVVVIAGKAYLLSAMEDLYADFSENDIIEKDIDFIAIPYFSWANRRPGAMKIWLPLH